MVGSPAERKLAEFLERPLRPGDPGLRPKGRLLIIGGREDKEDDKLILRTLARFVGDGKLVIAPLASEQPDEVWRTYEPVMRGLGVRHVHHLRIEERADGMSLRAMKVLEDARAVFFTGGDQVRITTLVGDTPVFSRIFEIFLEGGMIAGTSAGASIMSDTMMVRGEGDASHRITGSLQLAPGLGFVRDVVIDQHFAERGRIGRLLGVVGHNPRVLGVGIDEDTAIDLRPAHGFRVVGAGAVTVVDGSRVTYTNLAEEEPDRTMSMFGVTIHVLSQGDTFDIRTRRPDTGPAEAVEAELEESRSGSLAADD